MKSMILLVAAVGLVACGSSVPQVAAPPPTSPSAVSRGEVDGCPTPDEKGHVDYRTLWCSTFAASPEPTSIPVPSCPPRPTDLLGRDNGGGWGSQWC